MKKIDQLLLKTFAGPFFVTFFITLFLIVMQFLWKYVDDMIGKGIELLVLGELMFYASASFVPLALPLAMLLSSIMTLGKLGENNELVALKSSGIPLSRFILPLVVASVFISMGAFYFSNQVLPVANLKFASLLYDIRRTKPALNIREGVFYNGIDGFSILAQGKGEEDNTLFDLMVYDHTEGQGNNHILIAEKGEMTSSEDERFLTLKLYDGRQYKEMKPKKDKNTFEHTVLEFKEWEKIFDLSEFNMERTDESFFKDHYQMLSVFDLQHAIDTLNMKIDQRKMNLKNYLNPYFSFKQKNVDSLIAARNLPPWEESGETPLSYIDKIPPAQQLAISKRGLSLARNVKSFVNVAGRDINYQKTYLVKHQLAWHRKFTLSVACLILFFIGAPLGAIIRKGGLGWPLVISIIFFIIFHVSSMIGEKLAEEHVLTAFGGMWLSSGILLPIGIFFTYKASRDSRLFNRDAYDQSVQKLLAMFRKKQTS